MSGRFELNPEEDSDGMACAESVNGGRLIPLFTGKKWKILPQLLEKKHYVKLERSAQSPDDTNYTKNAKPMTEVRPYLLP